MSTDGFLLRAEHLTKKVSSPEGELTILDSVTICVPRGHTAAIVGPSGAGKSTLLALLAGLDEPTSGKVWLNGAELTALENVMLPLELAGRRDARRAARETLGRVGLGARTSHYPRQLSGGEQQRVALARAFVTQPAVLFADEPTGNLDTVTGGRIGELLFELNSTSQTTLVLVTHDDTLATRCSRVLRMEAGGLVQ